MDIKSLILNQLPGGLDKIAEGVGVDKTVVDKVLDAGLPEIIKEGKKTEGGIFDNLEVSFLSKTISSKIGIDERLVLKVLSFALPYIKENIDAGELMKIISGLSDGFGMDDVQNIAGAILENDSKKAKSGFLGNILGGLFGKK